MAKIEDDPVYNQPNRSKAKPTEDPSAPKNSNANQDRKSKSESQDKEPIADDPVYNQPKPISESDPGTDPKWEQHPNPGRDGTSRKYKTPRSDQPPKPDGKGEVNEDPTYNQDHKNKSAPSSDNAKARLSQLSSHLNQDSSMPSQPKRRRSAKRKTSSNLPADWSDILGHVSTMKSIIANPPSDHRGYSRQKAAGKLTARERMNVLTEGRFYEIGSTSGSTTWEIDPRNPISERVKSFTPANNPQGLGLVTVASRGTVASIPRKCYITSDDFAIRAGHLDGAAPGRTLLGEKLALSHKLPVIKLVDGSSGGGSVTTIAKQGFSYLPMMWVLNVATQQLNAGIPNLGCILGPAIGLGAARAVSCHFSVMAADVGSLFNAGPAVVAKATGEEGLTLKELGGPEIHCRNGTVDNAAPDEQSALEMVKAVLGYLPDCGALQAPPVWEEEWSGDDTDRLCPELRTIVPRRKTRGFDVRRIIRSVCDKESWFEIGPLWGMTAITGLARLGGHPIAVLANNNEVGSGALDSLGSQKLMKMIRFADVFNLPIVQFVDVPGYAIGLVAERQATMKWGVELAKAYYASTTPIFSVLVRKAYGVAGGVMLDSRDPWARVSWPSGEWGSLPLEGGIEVGHSAEMRGLEKKAEDEMKAAGGDEEEQKRAGQKAREKRYKELESMYLRLMNPVRTANVFGVEEIVDPQDTRRIVYRWAKEMYGLVMQERLQKRASREIVPVFA